MTEWAALVLFSAVAAEGVLRLRAPVWAGRIAETARKCAHIIPSGHISDHWKERILPRYAADLFRASVVLLGILLLLGGLAFVLHVTVPGFFALLLSPAGMAASLITAAGFAGVRRLWLR